MVWRKMNNFDSIGDDGLNGQERYLELICLKFRKNIWAGLVPNALSYKERMESMD